MIQIDMEMPKSCVDCFLNRHMHCTITYDLIPLEKRLDNCPIHEVNTDSDTISRQAAISALWKALYDYEDKTKKQFQESKELDVSDWIQHRIFVQNMNDIDRQTIIDLPPAQPIVRCKDCKHYDGRPCGKVDWYNSADDFCSRGERKE